MAWIPASLDEDGSYVEGYDDGSEEPVVDAVYGPSEPTGPEYPESDENQFDNGSMAAVLDKPSSGGLSWSDVAKQFGLVDKKGNYDLRAILGATGAGLGLVGAATSTPQTQRSLGDLKAGLPGMSAAQSFSPEVLARISRPMKTGSALQRVYAADMPSPITPGQRYAEGGEVEGALSQAFSGAVQGDEGGQSDLIDAKLSPGEYVIDAESVSALGDGNTAAGIAKLDELRAKLREQKRGTPVDDIPPPAQGPLSYIGGEQ